jgi:GDP-4-dehydro-6-deoxy-D-mannose reductase
MAASSLLEKGIDPVLLVVGSGTQYGRHAESEMPLVESAEQLPLSVYAETKKQQEIETLHIGRERGLRVVCARSFNHSGPGQQPPFLLPSLVARVRSLPRRGGTIPLGNDTIRDYLHVTDVVDAYIALSERGFTGQAYNVCSGEGVGTYDLAREVLAAAGVDATLEPDQRLQRAEDIPILIGSPARLMHDTLWSPTRSRMDLIRDLLHAR